MVVIPSYHIGDLVEHVSLRHWVEELRLLQENGKMKHDALIFINFDADSDFWSGVDLPWPLEWLPNTDGIGALVREIQDLPYVHFSSLSDYLKHHSPVGTFHFSQDTADGSFNGYNSWAEKAQVGPQWTRIERSRRVNSAARKAISLLNHPAGLADLPKIMATAELIRLRALSTTHFGMATPYVAPQRQQAMENVLARLDRYSDEIQGRIAVALRSHLKTIPPMPPPEKRLKWLDTFALLQCDETNINGSRFLNVEITGSEPSAQAYVLADSDGSLHHPIPYGPAKKNGGKHTLRLYVPGAAPLTDGVYHLYRDLRRIAADTPSDRVVRIDKSALDNGTLSLHWDRSGKIDGIYLDGERMAEAGSLMPHVRHNDKVLALRDMDNEIVQAADSRSASVRLTGRFAAGLADRADTGGAAITISMMAGHPYILLNGHIDYPTTRRSDIIKAGAPGLTRRVDLAWHEVAPAEVRFAPPATRDKPFRILKRNYLGVETEYALDYFRHSEDNVNLDNVNNHITQSYVGVVADTYGMAMAADTTVMANFAFAPLKMRHRADSNTFHLRANPFGTYHGKQYRPPTWGNGQGYDLTLHTGEHLFSAGPTYNGVSHEFDLLFAFFKEARIPAAIKQDLQGFAHPPLLISKTANPADLPPRREPLKTPTGFTAAYHDGTVFFSWESVNDPWAHYRIHCGTQPGQYERVYPATGTGLNIKEFKPGFGFQKQLDYFARIESISAKGATSGLSEEIHFRVESASDKEQPKIPLKLELKIVWTNLRALIAGIVL
jgi:hypothetical protein